MQKASYTKKFDGNFPPILVIAGPTASGKSHLALVLAERLGGEIVNADSMQTYRELSILTGRPSPEDEFRVPHHLYGFLPLADRGSAGTWLKAAVIAIEEIRSRQKVPIVCGGTGLYLKVLCEGIAQVPDISHNEIDAARKLFDEEGGIAFRARLYRIDPSSANRLPYTDRQRLIRAYVVQKSTGISLDNWKAAQLENQPVEGVIFVININPPRDALYNRINRRLVGMVEAGALDEVACLDPDLDLNLPGLKALGVKQFRNHLDGQCTLDEAIAKVQKATRNFAKRQITWFRNQLAADFLIDGFGEKSGHEVIKELTDNFSLEIW